MRWIGWRRMAPEKPPEPPPEPRVWVKKPPRIAKPNPALVTALKGISKRGIQP